MLPHKKEAANQNFHSESILQAYNVGYIPIRRRNDATSVKVSEHSLERNYFVIIVKTLHFIKLSKNFKLQWRENKQKRIFRHPSAISSHKLQLMYEQIQSNAPVSSSKKLDNEFFFDNGFWGFVE